MNLMPKIDLQFQCFFLLRFPYEGFNSIFNFFSNKDVFKFSHNRRQYSVSQLKENLFLLIGVDDEDPLFSLNDSNQASLNDSNQVSLNDSNKVSLNDSNQASLFEEITQYPEFLVSKKIRHCFKVVVGQINKYF